jgi:hypothetical protein
MSRSLTSATILIAIFALVSWVLVREANLQGHPAFEAWKVKYSVTYENPRENQFRQSIFLQNLELIEASNKLG